MGEGVPPVAKAVLEGGILLQSTRKTSCEKSPCNAASINFQGANTGGVGKHCNAKVLLGMKRWVRCQEILAPVLLLLC